MKTETDPTKITLHKDRTITYWSVFEQRWARVPVERIPDRELAAMTPDARARVLAALERHERATPPRKRAPVDATLDGRG